MAIRSSVDAKPADELVRAVGCAEDAGGDDLLPARPLAGLFGELDAIWRNRDTDLGPTRPS
jgi:hypothetical protein